MTYFDDYEDDYILRDLRDDVCHPTFSNLLSLDCMIHNMSVTDSIHKLIHQRVTDNNVLNILDYVWEDVFTTCAVDSGSRVVTQFIYHCIEFLRQFIDDLKCIYQINKSSEWKQCDVNSAVHELKKLIDEFREAEKEIK